MTHTVTGGARSVARGERVDVTTPDCPTGFLAVGGGYTAPPGFIAHIDVIGTNVNWRVAGTVGDPGFLSVYAVCLGAQL
jgi:hypothetical protein